VEWVDKVAEERILQAEQEGAFNNLRGHGKPLPPDPFFRLPDEIRLAARVLTICGCAPHEVGLLRELAEAKRRLGQATTAEEQAERMREYAEAELRYNVAMDRHRQMFTATGHRALARRRAGLWPIP